MRKDINHDIPMNLLRWLALRLPHEESVWADAVLGEMAAMPQGRERTKWALGGIWGLGKIWMRVRMARALGPDRPLAVTLIALYHAIFSSVIVGLLLWQLPRMRTSWSEAFFPVLISVFVALIPAVIAVGLWLLEDAARSMAILFSLLHAVGNWALLSTHQLPWKVRPVGRIALDLAMIGILLLPSIRRAFRPMKVELGLKNLPGDTEF